MKLRNFAYILLISITLLFIAIAFVLINTAHVVISNIKVTNLSENSATIIWLSSRPTESKVLVTLNPLLLEEKFLIQPDKEILQMRDDRDRNTNSPIHSKKRYTHHVTLTHLKPNTTYYYQINTGLINSDNDSVETAEFTTDEVRAQISAPDPIYGKIELDDQNNFQDAIVLVNIETPNGSTLERSSFVYQNAFSLDLANLTMEDQSKYSSNSADHEILRIYGYADEAIRTVTMKIPLDQDQPTPNVLLNFGEQIQMGEEDPAIEGKDLKYYTHDLMINSRALELIPTNSLNGIYCSVANACQTSTFRQEESEFKENKEGYSRKSQSIDILPDNTVGPKIVEIPVRKSIQNHGTKLDAGLTARAFAQTPNISYMEPGVYTLVGEQVSAKTIEVEESSNVRLFYDNNDNGIKESNEPYLSDKEANKVQYKVNKIADLIEYTLFEGWNLLGFPMLMQGESTSNIRMASELYQVILDQLGEATHICAYRNGNFVIYSNRLSQSGIAESFGEDFVLVGGEGYFIKSLKNTNIVLKGQKAMGSIPVLVNPGWNLIGLYSGQQRETSGYEILEDMSKQSVEPEVLSTWNSGLYSNIIVSNDQRFGVDFDVNETSGYWLKSNLKNIKVYTPLGQLS